MSEADDRHQQLFNCVGVLNEMCVKRDPSMGRLWLHGDAAHAVLLEQAWSLLRELHPEFVTEFDTRQEMLRRKEQQNGGD